MKMKGVKGHIIKNDKVMTMKQAMKKVEGGKEDMKKDKGMARKMMMKNMKKGVIY